MSMLQTARITVEIPIALQRKVKAYVAFNDINVKSFIINLIKSKFDEMTATKTSKDIPNKITLKTLKETEEGKNLVRYESPMEFLEKMEKEFKDRC